MKPSVKIPSRFLAALLFSFLVLRATATTYYVDINNPNPMPPYTSWSTASTDIQNAVNQTTNGDLVLVDPGVYQSSGYVSPHSNTIIIASVVITNAITLQSANGSVATAINGNNNMICIYLGDGATLAGFTITNGTSVFFGGILCADQNATVSNCLIINNIGGTYGGGAQGGTYFNCTFTGNSNTNAYYNPRGFGGGVDLATLNNCFLFNNSGGYGGGAAACTLNNCIVSNNFGYQAGGGIWNSTAFNSLIISNSTGPEKQLQNYITGFGGGADASVISNCIVQGNCAGTGGGVSSYGGGMDYALNSQVINSWIIGNSATDGGGCAGPYGITAIIGCTITDNCAANGGGVYYYSWLYNCLVIGNSATNGGGGAWLCNLYDCTVCQNSAGTQGGGILGRLAENCIVYYNTALLNSNIAGMYSVNNCCFGQDATGSGFFTNAPLFANLSESDFHLQSNSPCINAGNNAYTNTTTDLDSHPRIIGGTVDLGCYEYQSPVSALPYLWLEQYDLPLTNNIDTSSPNGTAFNVYQDWIAGLNPTNPASVLAMMPPPATNNTFGITVSWQSVGGIHYNLLRSTNLSSTFATLAANISGQAGTTSYKDISATNNVPYFYRVAVP